MTRLSGPSRVSRFVPPGTLLLVARARVGREEVTVQQVVDEALYTQDAEMRAYSDKRLRSSLVEAILTKYKPRITIYRP